MRTVDSKANMSDTGLKCESKRHIGWHHENQCGWQMDANRLPGSEVGKETGCCGMMERVRKRKWQSGLDKSHWVEWVAAWNWQKEATMTCFSLRKRQSQKICTIEHHSQKSGVHDLGCENQQHMIIQIVDVAQLAIWDDKYWQEGKHCWKVRSFLMRAGSSRNQLYTHLNAGISNTWDLKIWLALKELCFHADQWKGRENHDFLAGRRFTEIGHRW